MITPRECDVSPAIEAETAPSGLAGTWWLEGRIAERRRAGELADAAVTYWRVGLNVLPLEYGEKRPPKRYPLRLQFLTRFALADDVRALWDFRPLNIGVVLGATSDNLCEIDCDSLEAYESVFNAFLNTHIDPWVYRGQRGGKFLFYCRDGELRNADLRPFIDAEIRGNDCQTVLPPSVHPEGPEYTWILRTSERPPVLTLAQIQAVVPLARLKVRRRLNDDALDFLEHGAPEGQRETRLSQAAFSLGQHGTNEADATRDLLAAAAKCTPPLSAREARATIRRSFDAGQRNRNSARNRSARRTNAISENARAYVESRAWPGRTGATDRAVMLALAERCRCEGPVFRASVREVAELARMNKETVSRALRRLADAGLIRRAQRRDGDGHDAARWSFAIEGQRTESRTVHFVSRRDYCTDFAPLADAIGHTAYTVFRLVSATERATPAYVRDAGHLSAYQVKRALDKLCDAGLIMRLARGVYAAQSGRADEYLEKGRERGYRRGQGHAKERSARLFRLALRCVQGRRPMETERGRALAPLARAMETKGPRNE